MQLVKLFETQQALDEHIYEKHPELRGQNNLNWKILALQVELGECANEWRGFKKWSHDQEPRVYMPNPKKPCNKCNGEGYFDKHKDIKEWILCLECDGVGVHYHNPLLEEYVDCLHFILSIGLELSLTDFKSTISRVVLSAGSDERIKQFSEVFRYASTFENYAYDEKDVWYYALFSNFLGLGKTLGFTWEQIEEAYFAKNKVNHKRQEANY